MSKKIIEVTIKVSFPINESGPAQKFNSQCSDFINDLRMKGLENYILCHTVGYEVRTEHNSYPKTTCEWCEKDFERSSKV